MTHDTFSQIAYGMGVDTELLGRFRKARIYHGDPSRKEIINKIKSERTRTVCPPGWKFR
jgi:hypothetical protein